MDERATRASWDSYFMSIADAVASRSTCLHRHQGAVIVRDNHILCTGFNGSPPGQPHCSDLGWCAKDEGEPCRAAGCHGESKCIAWAARTGTQVLDATLYSVYSPCRDCCNLLAVVGIKCVKYKEVYDSYREGLQYLESLGIQTEVVLDEITGM